MNQAQEATRKRHIMSLESLMREFRDKVSQESTPAAIDYYRALKTYAEIIRENPELDEKDTDAIFLATELKKLGLHSRDSEMFTYFSDGDVVEVYNMEHAQLFRNFEYFRHSSYSAYAIMTSRWPQLFERKEEILHSMQADLTSIFSSNGERPCVLSTPLHIVKERGAKQYEFVDDLKFGWCLFDRSEKVAGYLITHRLMRQDQMQVQHLG